MAVIQTEAHNKAEDAVAAMFGEKPQHQTVDETPPEVEQAGTEEQSADGQEQAENAAPQSEEVEVEIDGEKYLVPKKISDRFIQHADYTRKTQDVAEMRRALSAEREVSNLNRAFDQAVAAESQRLGVLDAQIQQYRNVDWAAIEDTGQLVKMREQLNQLKEMRAELDQSIKAKRVEFDTKIKGHVQEALQAGEKYVSQHVKDWNESTKKELFNFGVSIGYSREEMDRISDPRIVVSLYEQKMWRDLQASKPGTLNKAAQAAPTVRPGASNKPVSRVQALSTAFQKAKGAPAKKQAAEDYFTARFGGK